MKNHFLICIAILFSFALFVTSCDSDDDGAQLDENGLTKDITNLVPQEILTIMIENGLPIYGGANPPNIEGEYLVSPLILLNSNVPGESPGVEFPDLELFFRGQNNRDLKVMVNTNVGDEMGVGLGSFIVGDDCEFSVFVEIFVTRNSDNDAKAVQVFSGCLSEDGIKDLITAVFVIDDNGDPYNEFIENGEGRVLYDEDRLSERI